MLPQMLYRLFYFSKEETDGNLSIDGIVLKNEETVIVAM